MYNLEGVKFKAIIFKNSTQIKVKTIKHQSKMYVSANPVTYNTSVVSVGCTQFFPLSIQHKLPLIADVEHVLPRFLN